MIKKISLLLILFALPIFKFSILAEEHLFLKHISQTEINKRCEALALMGDMVFTGEDKVVSGYNISDPENPLKTMQFSNSSQKVHAIEAKAPYLFVLYSKTLMVYKIGVDISAVGKYTFSEMTSLTMAVSEDCVYIGANTDYGGSGSLGLIIVKTDFEALESAGTDLIAVHFDENVAPSCLSAHGQRLYMTTECLLSSENQYPGAFIVYDIENPFLPVKIRQTQLSFGQNYAQFAKIACSENNVYIAVRDGQDLGGGSDVINGVWQFDINTNELNNLDLSGTPYGKRISGLFINGDIMYVNSLDSCEIRVYDISEKPLFLQSFRTKSGDPDGARILGVKGNEIYLADNMAGWGIYGVNQRQEYSVCMVDENNKITDYLQSGNIYAAINGINYSAEEFVIEGTLVLAVYKDNKLIDIKFNKNPIIPAGTVSKNIKTPPINVPLKYNGYTAKAMLLESFDDIKPLFKIKSAVNISAVRDSEEIFVDPVNGDDKNIGTESSPLKTLTEARNYARTSENISIYLKSGTYKLEDTLVFDERDSGGITLKGIGEVVISGGVKIDNWIIHDSEKNIYKADAKGIKTRQLYVNGKRVQRARSKGILNKVTIDNGEYGMETSDLFLADYAHIEDLEMVYRSIWCNQRIGVSNVEITDENRLLVKMNQPHWERAVTAAQTGVFSPVYYENVYELLDEEGEFYLDIREDVFYYKPYSNESDIIAYTPVLEEIMTINNSSDITFENITFSYSDWYLPTGNGGYVDGQNNLDYRDNISPAAVTVANAKNISFKSCKFEHLGAIGLKASAGVTDFNISDSIFTDISSNALFIGEYDPNPPQNARISRVVVKNNYIHNTGVEYMGSAAVTIGFISDSEFSYNEIGNVPYSGFHMGWGWGEVVSSAMENVIISNNYIHNIVCELQDGGAIYTLGGSGSIPNIIKENYIENQHEGTAALYADSGSSNYIFMNNVVKLPPSECFIYYAFANDFANNVTFSGNYTNTYYHANHGSDDNVFENTYEYSVIPPLAQEIIDSAGVKEGDN